MCLQDKKGRSGETVGPLINGYGFGICRGLWLGFEFERYATYPILSKMTVIPSKQGYGQRCS